ncbi:ThuA domain-containing protein [uncultured Amnibacterium sp.]|uniref:ThuA domain-containing protein n=1 Tax=uncultured Amnibacterium sp. TaxID=1631851 RepID=UPI0035CA928D
MTEMVLLAGEPEYDSQLTMPPLAADIAAGIGARLHVRTPDVLEDTPEFPRSTFGDLGVLDDADLLIIYTRFRNLADEEIESIAQYLRRGGAVIGVRTATHAFRLPATSSFAGWGDAFGRDVLGSPWVRHHGHSSSTDVTTVPGRDDLLDGVPRWFRSRSWLYTVDLAAWATPLLQGVPVDPETAAEPAPVAWSGFNDGRRTFVTTLGHPDDFASEPFRALLRNAARWAVQA